MNEDDIRRMEREIIRDTAEDDQERASDRAALLQTMKRTIEWIEADNIPKVLVKNMCLITASRLIRYVMRLPSS